MSIIFKDPKGKIKIYIKGANSQINKRLSDKSKKCDVYKELNNFNENFSKLGYRTLMVAFREIKENEYNKWREKLHLEELNLQKKHKIIEKYYDEIEKNFGILGETVVEDKLQDRVSETIKDIKAAGIKFWVLTGDKICTAENIGFSCNLLSKEQKIFKLYCRDDDEERMKYDFYKETIKFFNDFRGCLILINYKEI